MKKVIEFNLWDSAYEANKEFYTKEQIDDMTLDELMELADQTDAVDDKDAIHTLNKTSKMEKLDTQEKFDLLLSKLNIEYSENYDDMLRSSVSLYPESTADGYEVFVLDYGNGANISESVYYYETSAIQEFIDCLTYHSHDLVYIDEDLADSFSVKEEIVDRYFGEHVRDIVLNYDDFNLSENDIKLLMVEYQEEIADNE